MRSIVRWENGKSQTVKTDPTKFDAERANAIIAAGSQYDNYQKHMTDGEIAYVMDVWDAMSPTTCFYDALLAIRRNKLP